MALIQLAPGVKEGLTIQAENPQSITRQEYALMSDTDKNPSIVITSRFAGKPLKDYLDFEGTWALGRKSRSAELPFIITEQDLSNGWPLMIHYDDRKLKLFYILEAAPDAAIYYGLENEKTAEELAASVEKGTLQDDLKKIAIQAGDVFVIEPGTIFALENQIKLIEVETKGETPEFPMEKQLERVNLKPIDADYRFEPVVDNGQASTAVLASCDAFNVFKTDLHGKAVINVDEDSFADMIVLSGSAIVTWKDKIFHANQNDSIFMEADSGEVSVVGNCSYLYITR